MLSVIVEEFNDRIGLFVIELRASHRLHSLYVRYRLNRGRTGLQTLIQPMTLLALYCEDPVALLNRSRIGGGLNPYVVFIISGCRYRSCPRAVR